MDVLTHSVPPPIPKVVSFSPDKSRPISSATDRESTDKSAPVSRSATTSKDKLSPLIVKGIDGESASVELALGTFLYLKVIIFKKLMFVHLELLLLKAEDVDIFVWLENILFLHHFHEKLLYY